MGCSNSGSMEETLGCLLHFCSDPLGLMFN